MSNPPTAAVSGLKQLTIVFRRDLVFTRARTGISARLTRLALTFTSRKWVGWKHEICCAGLHARTHECRTVCLAPDSSARPNEMCESPLLPKRRTGRRNKPSLMETWHARWGGNSNKRLMGHGALRVQQQNTLRCRSLLPRSVPCWPRGSERWWGSNISRPRPLGLSTDELSGVDDATASCRPEDLRRNSAARNPASGGWTAVLRGDHFSLSRANKGLVLGSPNRTTW